MAVKDEIKISEALKILFLVTVLGAYMALGRSYAKVWQDNHSLWGYVSLKSPAKARPMSNFGLALYDRKEFEAAEEAFMLAIRFDPTFANAYINLGTVFFEAGDYKDALDMFEKAAELKPASIALYYNLARTYIATGMFNNALAELNMALQLNKDFPGAYNARGIVFTSRAIRLKPWRNSKRL